MNETEFKLAHSPFAYAFKGKYAELGAPLVVGGKKPKSAKKKKATRNPKLEDEEGMERAMNPLPSPGSVVPASRDEKK